MNIARACTDLVSFTKDRGSVRWPRPSNMHFWITTTSKRRICRNITLVSRTVDRLCSALWNPCQIHHMLPEFYSQFGLHLLTNAFLDAIDLLISKAALHRPVSYPEAVGGLALLLVLKLINQLHLLDQVTTYSHTRCSVDLW